MMHQMQAKYLLFAMKRHIKNPIIRKDTVMSYSLNEHKHLLLLSSLLLCFMLGSEYFLHVARSLSKSFEHVQNFSEPNEFPGVLMRFSQLSGYVLRLK